MLRPPSWIRRIHARSPLAAPDRDVVGGDRTGRRQVIGQGARDPGPGRGQGVAGQGLAAEDRLQAAGVAAAAVGALGVDLDVADVAGTAVRATVGSAVDGDPAADAGADLDEEHVVGRPRHAAMALADRHDVHVVVHDDRAVVLTGQEFANGVPVPTGHDRWRHRLPVAEAHRAGNADPQAGQAGERAVGGELGEDVVDPAQRGPRDRAGCRPAR